MWHPAFSSVPHCFVRCDRYRLASEGDLRGNRSLLLGVFFHKTVAFVPDIKDSSNVLAYMSGESILKACAKFGLRYQLTAQSGQISYISYISYSPTEAPTNHGTDRIFPFIGQPLSLIQTLRPVGEISNVFQ